MNGSLSSTSHPSQGPHRATGYWVFKQNVIRPLTTEAVDVIWCLVASVFSSFSDGDSDNSDAVVHLRAFTCVCIVCLNVLC